MPRGSLFLLLGTVALAQVPPRDPDPFDRALQAMQQARSQGNPAAAAARREEARQLLDQMPADSPQWPGRVQTVAQMYQGSGRHTEARAVLQDALDRAGILPEWYPARIQLLDALAGMWQQDGNLLKALAYREKAIAAFEAAPPGAAAKTPQPGAPGNTLSVLVDGARATYFNGSRLSRGRPVSSNSYYLYRQLAGLDRQLGRLEDASKVLGKLRALIKDDPAALANSYEEEGNLAQARALLQKQFEQAAADPKAQTWEVVGPLQTIASLDEREDRFAEAAAALEQAAARLDASAQAEARDQALNVRLRLASLLHRSGQQAAADEMYQALLSQNDNRQPAQQVQVPVQYANYLAQTNRGNQGIALLKDYLATHSDLPPWQATNLLLTLAQVARQSGQSDLADQYQRAADAKQRSIQPPREPLMRQAVDEELQKAQAAANQGNLDDAVNLALAAIGSAALAPDGDQIAWRIPSIAGGLAGKQAPEKGEQLYRALFPALEARSIDNVGPLQQAWQQYARFLMNRKERAGDAALAIDGYRESVIATHGVDTNAMIQVLQLRIELARAQQTPEQAARAAEDMLAVEESLSGNSSAPYLQAAQTAAEVFRTSGKTEQALALYREIAAIADRAISPNDPRRGFVRMNAAMAFATAGQFDEAERLAAEAIAAGEAMHPPRADTFRSQAGQI